MDTKKVYDIVGIGIGPFNLGMAALADGIENLQCAFIDKQPEFNWHPGMMIPGTALQVPFYADLVTIVNPQSRYSFLNYLKHKKRLFRFAVYENNFISRQEYNDYCRWVAGQLASLHFGYNCGAVNFIKENGFYEVRLTDNRNGHTVLLQCKHLVIGIGTIPYLPDCARSFKQPTVFHSADYLKFKDSLLEKKSVSIVGSGQSAAEIFYDLLNTCTPEMKLNWFTRSNRFFPMEYSKLTLEMTSPDYIEHFFALPVKNKPEVLRSQDMLYKGINFSLINSIYDKLYEHQSDSSFTKPGMYTNCEMHAMVQKENDQIKIGFLHCELEETFSVSSEVVILATGYCNHLPFTLDTADGPIKMDKRNKMEVNRNYSINKRNDIFVQNMDLHSHGFTSPDLGMGPYRNATILNTILGYEYFEMESNIAFQTFGVPKT